MYESHFGFTGSPFQLNPDPAFYFDSRGHSNALSYLKFGVHQGEGFIVVTGEIGAGKTTLVKTLLGSLDPGEVVAAQVVSTQLESGELLQAILAAFGVPPSGASKAHLIASLEGFLTALAARGRRALLIVDEAQNLGFEALEELRMLSNFQLGQHALLQSFLVGQPELRELLHSKSLEQLRQRVIASCHLGPLDAQETRAYVEHRLRHVGWTDRPRFEAAAFERIHHWTGGIPRRVNSLCNRLLLSAFLGGMQEVASRLVDDTAREFNSETGGALRASPLPQPGAPAAPVAMPGTLRILDHGVQRVARVDAARLRAPLVCIADSAVGFLKFAALAAAIGAQAGAPAVVLVNPRDAVRLDLGEGFAEVFEPVAMEVHLGVMSGPAADQAAALMLRLDVLLDELKPSAAISLDDSDAVLSCALLCRRRGLPLLRAEAGRRGDADAGAELNRMLVDRFSDLLYTQTIATHYALYRESVPAERLVCVGDLSANVLQRLAPLAPRLSDRFESSGLPRPWVRRAAKGYALVAAQAAAGGDARDRFSKMAALLCEAAQAVPLLWPVDEATFDLLHARGLERALREAGVAVAPSPGYLHTVGFLQGAACVVADQGAFLSDEIRCSGKPCVAIHMDGDMPSRIEDGTVLRIGPDLQLLLRTLKKALEEGSRGAGTPAAPASAGAARAIAEHLRAWLPRLDARVWPAAHEAAA